MGNSYSRPSTGNGVCVCVYVFVCIVLGLMMGRVSPRGGWRRAGVVRTTAAMRTRRLRRPARNAMLGAEK